MTVKRLSNNIEVYEHHAREPKSSDQHEKIFVPQPVLDGWSCHCSCGARWFASFYDHDTKEDAVHALAEAHAEHLKEVSNE